MADIPIHNDTDYALTEAMTQDILRDAQEHFGDVIRSIRVQSGCVPIFPIRLPAKHGVK
jgi:hypothetical protein